MKNFSIAVIMSCYNRQEKTLACLKNLFNQKLPPNLELSVYLLDDASTDDTANAVGKSYPEVIIIEGNGGLFWNGGMRLAWGEAMKKDYDYYLWLNDDTILYPDALLKLFTTSRTFADKGQEKVIVAGSTCDPATGELTYGAVVRRDWWHPFHYNNLKPGEEAKPCHTMHGNCVLIPRVVVQLVGNLEPIFTHGAGDFDYGLRAKQKGCSVWIVSGYVGTCSWNQTENSIWKSVDMSLKERLKKVIQPKGLPPNESKVFAQRHGGILWPFYWSLPYIRLFLKSIFSKSKAKHDS